MNIEFPIHGIGQTVTCPKCGLDTILFDHRVRTPDVPEILAPEEKPAKPAKYVLPYSEYRSASLLVLQEQGFVRTRIAQKILRQLPDKPWETIYEHYPRLLTSKGIHVGVSCEIYVARQQEIRRMDLSAVAGERGMNESAATEKQINFMRSLGLRDEALLSRLGVKQATRILDKLLEGRERRNC